jgi:cytochrome c-type biogenesis protein
MHPLSLAAPAFLAGILMFLAPCTLPLVPAFLGFLGGAHDAGTGTVSLRRRVFVNAVLYVIGFTAVFIVMGTLFGLAGSAIAHHRTTLTRIGGAFVLLFGMSMTGIISLAFLERERRFRPIRFLKPGNPGSALLFGMTFALGWSPCIGPILGSILLLASSSSTAVSGAILLAIFSMGLALPFLAIAAGYGHAAQHTAMFSRVLPWITRIGGIFLMFMGVLMLFDRMDIWLGFVFEAIKGIDYGRIIDLV